MARRSAGNHGGGSTAVEGAPGRQPVALDDAAHDDGDRERDEGGEQQVANQRGAAPHRGRDDDQDRGDDQHVGQRLPDRVEEVGEAPDERDERPLDCRRRDREDCEDREEEERHDELDGIARSTCTRLVDRRGEQSNATESSRAHPQPTHAADSTGSVMRTSGTAMIAVSGRGRDEPDRGAGGLSARLP